MMVPLALGLILAASVGAEPPCSRITWDDAPITVFAPARGGAWYPRLAKLPDGSLLCAYDTRAGAALTVVQVSRSRDGGSTWDVLGKASFGIGNAANGQLLPTEDGLLCAYRLVSQSERRIKLARSRDGGRTWEDWSTPVVNREGAREPHLIRGRHGEILLFYATEARRPQAIALKRSRDGGKTWGAEAVVASHPKSRDGMPVAARTRTGAIVVVFEAQDGGHPFVIRCVTSTDEGRTCSQGGWYTRQETGRNGPPLHLSRRYLAAS